MPANFLEYYRKNLTALRSSAEDFARAYPKIASYLALSNFECADPFVERLLEGSAFLAAQVEAKLDAGHSRLLQQLVAHTAPLFNMPLPALACVQMHATADGVLPLITTTQRFKLPTIHKIDCTFSALWPLQLQPVQLTEWTYHQRVSDELPELKLSAQAKSVLACEVHQSAPLNTIRAWRQKQAHLDEPLDLFCPLPEIEASSLYQLLRDEQQAVYVRTNDVSGRTQLHELELLPCTATLYQQPNLLHEVVGGAAALDYLALYLHYPALCKFIRLQHFLKQWQQLGVNSGRLIIVFKRDCKLISPLTSESLLTHVVPLINIFAQRSNRLPLTLRSEYQLHIDRTHPRDYEVLTVNGIECYDQQQHLSFRAVPLTGLKPEQDYLAPQQSATDATDATDATSTTDGLESAPTAYFALERRIPTVTATPRSLYALSNVYVAFSGTAYTQTVATALAEKQEQLAAVRQDSSAPLTPQLRDLGRDFVAQCYCSNGDLPFFLVQGAEVRSNDAALRGTVLGEVIKMSPAALTTATADDLQLLSFVLMNTTALLRQNNNEIVAYLRALLVACGGHSSEVEQLARSIVGFSRERMTFRVLAQGVVFFEEGTQLTVTIDESFLGGSGALFVAELLAQVLLSALALNTRAQLQVVTTTQEEVGVWLH